jgi:hypothetical protein
MSARFPQPRCEEDARENAIAPEFAGFAFVGAFGLYIIRLL